MLTDNDLLWLKSNYPSLKQTKPDTIEGRLSFRMLRFNGSYIVNPSIESLEKTSSKDYLYIFDSYQVRIEWEKGKPPLVFETGKKLAKVAKRLNIKNLLDMHQFQETGALCLASPMQLQHAFRAKVQLEALVEDFIVPYLFAQSHFAKTKEWIWDNLSHGYWGLIEWLGRQSRYDDNETQETYNFLWPNGNKEEIIKILKSRYRGYKICRCGSGRKIRECHPDRQLGIARIRGALHRGIIKSNDTGDRNSF